MKKKLLVILSIAIIIILNFSSVIATNDISFEEEGGLLGAKDGSTEEEDLMSMVIRIVFYLIAFVVVLFLTFYGTKLFAKYSRNMGKGNNIEVLEHFNLGNNNKILAIKIYDKTYILSVNNNNTTVIDSFDFDVANTQQEKTSNKKEFQKHLETVLSADKGNNGNTNLNNKLMNIKMKVMKLKNKQHEEIDIEEEDYEEEY